LITFARRIGLVAASAALFGCGPGPEVEERQRIAASIAALRGSKPDEVDARLALADKLAKEPAKTPEAVRARDACSKGYRLLAESRRAEAQVTAGLQGDDKGAALTAIKAIGEAQEKLDQARAAIDECNAAATALALKK
jgi:hypothetical protein